MKKNIEKEFKTMLTTEEYQTLKATFPLQTTVDQVNIYYDTLDQDLLKKKIMCRIRHLPNKQVFTLKVPIEQFKNHEFEFEDESIDLKDSRITGLLDQVGIHGPLQIVCQSATSRTIMETDIAYLCLDYTRFKNSADFELEMELKEHASADLEDFLTFLASVNVSYKPGHPKYQRALLDLNKNE